MSGGRLDSISNALILWRGLRLQDARGRRRRACLEKPLAFSHGGSHFFNATAQSTKTVIGDGCPAG